MSAPNLFPDVTRQNITDKLYRLSLINNTDPELSNELTQFVGGLLERIYTDKNEIQNAINNGELTGDTYILWPLAVVVPSGIPTEAPHAPEAPAFTVDTAERVLEYYPSIS